MDAIEEKLLRYPDLTREEQEAVDAHVDAHPELAALRRSVQRLYRLFDEAGATERNPHGDEALAYYALTRYLAQEQPTPSLRALNERLEGEIADSPAFRRRLDVLDRRLRDIEAGDAGAHFERLTGHSLNDPAGPTATVYSLRWMRLPAAAVIVLAVCYALLWGASEATVSEMEELAAISPDELSVEGYELLLRGPAAGGDSSSTHLLYLRALGLLGQARHTTLGLFPRYDEAALRRASDLLSRIIRREPDGTFLQLESYYFLGKAHLALGEPEEGQEALRAVVEGGGRNAGEAAPILRELGDD